MLVVATMALATSLSVLSAAAAAVAAQQAFRQVVEDLPPQERSVVVSLTPLPDSTRLAEIDGLVVANLVALGAAPVARQLVARDLTAAGYASRWMPAPLGQALPMRRPVHDEP